MIKKKSVFENILIFFLNFEQNENPRVHQTIFFKFKFEKKIKESKKKKSPKKKNKNLLLSCFQYSCYCTSTKKSSVHSIITPLRVLT